MHPQEALLQQARAYQATAAGRETLLKRQVVEHRLARLVQLGVRQSRYFGREKTRFQLLMAAAVANLTLTWSAPLRAAREQARNAAESVVASAVAALGALLTANCGLWAELGTPDRRAELAAAAT